MEYRFSRPPAINTEKLSDELKAQIAAVSGINTTPDAVVVIADALTAPEQATAQTVITAHSAALTTTQQHNTDAVAAAAAVQAGKNYLRRQLVSVSPDSLTTLVNTIKPVVDGNTYLLRMVNNKIDVMSAAYAWTAASVKAPATAADRARYIEAVMQIIALLA